MNQERFEKKARLFEAIKEVLITREREKVAVRINLDEIVADASNLVPFIMKNFPNCISISPKVHGAEKGIILRDGDETRYFIKFADINHRLFGRDSKLKTSLYSSILGEELSPSIKVYIRKNYAISVSKEISSRYTNFAKYLGMIEKIEKNIPETKNLFKIFIIGSMLGLTDIRSDNIIVDISNTSSIKFFLVDFLNPEDRRDIIKSEDVLTDIINKNTIIFNSLNEKIKSFFYNNNELKDFILGLIGLQSLNKDETFVPGPSAIKDKNLLRFFILNSRLFKKELIESFDFFINKLKQKNEDEVKKILENGFLNLIMFCNFIMKKNKNHLMDDKTIKRLNQEISNLGLSTKIIEKQLMFLSFTGLPSSSFTSQKSAIKSYFKLKISNPISCEIPEDLESEDIVYLDSPARILSISRSPSISISTQKPTITTPGFIKSTRSCVSRLKIETPDKMFLRSLEREEKRHLELQVSDEISHESRILDYTKEIDDIETKYIIEDIDHTSDKEVLKTTKTESRAILGEKTSRLQKSELIKKPEVKKSRY